MSLWALAVGSTLEDRPVYVKTTCFDKFPFPDSSEAAKETIREIAERLDAHRKRQQQLHPTLTLTEMYNVLEKLRTNEELTVEDHSTYEMGLVGILREIHDELDEAVFAAYGWPAEPEHRSDSRKRRGPQRPAPRRRSIRHRPLASP